MAESPFKFLDSYTREDREIFFGREREIEEMYRKIFDGKILLLYGISGTGKTSLINCGLANKFEDSDWLPVTVRRGRNIMESLDDELRKVTLTPLKKGTSLLKTIQSIYLDHFKPVYLIFDQFEELFIFGDRDERDEFIQTVREVVNSEIQCRFIFSIREEYLASVTEFEELIDEFLDNRMRVEKMTRQHAREVVEGPCRIHGIEVEEGFADALLQKLNPDSNEVELTYLQVFLDKIFRLSQEGRDDSKFSIKLIDEVGDVSDLLGSFLEEQVRQMEDPEAALAVLKAFVSVKGTKRQITEEEVSEFAKTLGASFSDGKLQEVIQQFVNLRILRDKDENGRYELRHDSLAAKIFEKITIVEKELIEIRQFIESAWENHLRRGIWLESAELEYIRPYRDRLFLSGELEGFVRTSTDRLERNKRVLRRISLISIAGLIIITSIIGGYYKRKMDKSVATDWSIESLLQAEQLPHIAFETAVEAYHIDTANALNKKAFYTSFYSLADRVARTDSLTGNLMLTETLVHSIRNEDTVIMAHFSDEGDRIYALLEDNRIMVWNLAGEKLNDIHIEGAETLHLKISGPGNHIAVLNNDSTIILINLSDTGSRYEYKTNYKAILPLEVFNFAPDGSLLAILDRDNRIALIDPESGEIFQRFEKPDSCISSVSISPDNELLAYSMLNGVVGVYRQKEKGRHFYELSKFRVDRAAIWSVTFNKNSRYLVTASADSSVQIRDLYGDWILGTYWWFYYEKDWKFDYFVSPYCHAEFGAGDRVIMITAYENKGDQAPPSFRKLEIYSHKSPVINTKYNTWMKNSRLGFDDLSWRTPPDQDHHYFDYDITGRYLAKTLGEETTVFSAIGQMPVKTVNGIQPRFSPDGKFLLCINGADINLYITDEREMINIYYSDPDFQGPRDPMEGWYFTY